MRTFPFAFAVILAATGVAGADEKVSLKRKPGLWEVSALADGRPAPMSLKQCADATTDAQMMQLSEMQSESCKISDFAKTAAGYEFSSECQIGGSKVVSKGVFSGDFDKEYTGQIVTMMTPPMFGQSESKSTITAKWLGECPSGMKPGDMQMGDGMTFGLEHAKQGAKRDSSLHSAVRGLKATSQR